MALVNKITIIEGIPSCNSIFFEDTTGDYNAITNSGGYGTPNPLKADITSTKLYATPAGSTTEILLLDDYLPTDGQIEITCDDWNTAVGNTELEVAEDTNECEACGDSSLSQLLGDDCEDGVSCFANGCWTFRYVTYTDASVAATVTVKMTFRCRMLRDLLDVGSKIYGGACPCRAPGELDSMKKRYNMLWNEFNWTLLKSELNDCDCSCVAQSMASIQRRIVEFQNLCC